MLKLLILPFFLLALLPVQMAFADTGPKPSMEFDFQFQSGVEESGIISAILYECNEADCSDAAPLEEIGPQGLYCEAQSCRAIGYGFAPFSILEIEFSDGVTRRSNIFEQSGFDSYYTVFVRPDDLYVEARFSPGIFPRSGTVLVASCICALVSLSLVVGTSFFVARRSKKN